MNTKTKQGLFRRFWPYLRKYRHIMIFDLIHNTILSNCAEFVTNIVPDYERTRFELHIKIRQKFSLPLIIFLLLRILLQRRSK